MTNRAANGSGPRCESSRIYYEKHREEILQKNKQWREANKEHSRAYRQRKGQTTRGKFLETKKRARKKGLTFELTQEEFTTIVLQNCFYCDKVSVENEKLNGIDRKDNNKGYEHDNCVSCCKRCNEMKSNETLEEWLQRMNRILIQQEYI